MTQSDQVWPNFFIVGTVKGGTTSVYQYLRKHPKVFLPDFKEPHYFAKIKPSKARAHQLQYIDNQEEYLKLFHGAQDYTAIGEASTSNLWSPTAPLEIHKKCPNAKIIMLLRDPLVRAHSHYLMDFREGVIDEPFSVEMLQRDLEHSPEGFAVAYLYVDMGLYFQQVKRYLDLFGSDQVLILEFSGLVTTPDKTMTLVSDFLEIENQPFNDIDVNKVHNGFKSPRGAWARKCAANPLARWLGYHLMPQSLQWWLYQNIILKKGDKPAIDSEVRSYLESVYEPDITKLEALIGKELPSLRESW